jgi:hypothetical protein
MINDYARGLVVEKLESISVALIYSMYILAGVSWRIFVTRATRIIFLGLEV